MTNESKTTRRSSPPIKVYCLPIDRRQIEVNAKAAGLSLSTYLMNVGLGYQIKGIVDNNEVEKLAKINGDLGRLGGLLKLWLTNDERTAHFSEATLRAVLSRIVDSQDRMVEVMASIVRPKAGK
ncbi:MAG: conjugal transfer transcriptional regulator TraJ [Methyloglobulus sp.]|nr:conjugal transfer transcriptional regulator TraJ [Methyloglobulus sp.]